MLKTAGDKGSGLIGIASCSSASPPLPSTPAATSAPPSAGIVDQCALCAPLDTRNQVDQVTTLTNVETLKPLRFQFSDSLLYARAERIRRTCVRGNSRDGQQCRGCTTPCWRQHGPQCACTRLPCRLQAAASLHANDRYVNVLFISSLHTLRLVGKITHTNISADTQRHTHTSLAL